jgi:predicted DNA-binding transcriptional regulator YafY
MSKSTKINSKTVRILWIYHMFRFSEEVSMQELCSNRKLQGRHKRTFSRDIALLKQAGIPIRFSVRRKAFVLTDAEGNESCHSKYRAEPEFPDGKKERQYLKKIIRLTTMMDGLPDKDCNVWYRATFPEASKRTMQRDFAILRSIKYKVSYKRSWYYFPDEDIQEDPPGHYYYTEVCNASVLGSAD